VVVTQFYVLKKKSNMQKGNDKQQMFQMIEGWKTSGLTQIGYCKQKGIAYHVFHYWYKLYRDEQEQNTSPTSSFVELQVEDTTILSSATNVELLLPDGKRLLFHGRVDACFLRLLLQ
jgi:hypothetical protein